MPHKPVLVKEILVQLGIEKQDRILDGTVGFGGHTSCFLEIIGNDGIIVGLDIDSKAVSYVKNAFQAYDNVHIYQDSYVNFMTYAEKLNVSFNKILIDLGYSSFQLDASKRGFSFLINEPLDMRMNTNHTKLTARQILNTYNENDLARIFIDFGELFNPQKLVRNIRQTRKKAEIKTTFDLVEIIKKSFYFHNKRSLYMKICSQVFQALRIEVNKELENLATFLENLKNIKAGTMVGIISFHSLEDRIVKNFVRNNKIDFKRINKKVIKASLEEIKLNLRAKSAKLRIFEKL
jgi:16S rRNA (cytosine1402-N4)-methyltransferase